YSLLVKALNSPPIASTSPAISRAVGRRSVPLKNMCSAKWAMPLVGGVSYRLPAASITITATDLAAGMGAVTTRRPLGRVVFWNMARIVVRRLDQETGPFARQLWAS